MCEARSKFSVQGDVEWLHTIGKRDPCFLHPQACATGIAVVTISSVAKFEPDFQSFSPSLRKLMIHLISSSSSLTVSLLRVLRTLRNSMRASYIHRLAMPNLEIARLVLHSNSLRSTSLRLGRAINNSLAYSTSLVFPSGTILTITNRVEWISRIERHFKQPKERKRTARGGRK